MADMARIEKARALLDAVLDAACRHVQDQYGQDDGGLAAMHFSGDLDEALVDGLGDLWREPGDAPLAIPPDTDVEAVPYLALANIAQNTGNAIPHDLRDSLMERFEGYMAAERGLADERASPKP